MNGLLLPLLLLFSQVLSEPLTIEENEEHQKTCGLGPTLNGSQSYLRKIINYDTLEPGDLPYVAVTYIRMDNGQMMVVPATIISPRHLATWNSITYDKDSSMFKVGPAFKTPATCEGDHVILPKERNVRFDYEFEFKDPYRDFSPTVDRVMIINGCMDKENVDRNYLLIYELKEPIKSPHTPVCLPGSPRDWNSAEKFIFHGNSKQMVMGVTALKPAKCVGSVRAPLSCAENVNKTQGLCSGDFGGGAVGQLNDRATLFGTYGSGNGKCAADTTTLEPYRFINFGYLSDAICEITGICARNMAKI